MLQVPVGGVVLTMAAHLRGGWGDKPSGETSAAGPANSVAEHDNRVA